MRREDDEIVLPKALQRDIEEQVSAFFEGRETFQQMRLRYRRGFLFVGQPGTGKTMMLRRLVRCMPSTLPSASIHALHPS